MAKKNICIVGGGASGVSLLWCLAKATQQKKNPDEYTVTIIHDGPVVNGTPTLGGHSLSVDVTVDGVTSSIDLGVQLIAPKMYPNMMSMLELPEFSGVTVQDVPLNISCTFPPVDGVTPYWGNFAAYQTSAMYQDGKADCETFEALMRAHPLKVQKLNEFLDSHESEFKNYQDFLTYFLNPYLSIMNGYGAALLNEVWVPEVAFLFNAGYASLTKANARFQRFEQGAMRWVDAMFNFAVSILGEGAVTVEYQSRVTSIAPVSNGATVTWTAGDAQTPQPPKTFDAVVSTVDMETNATILPADVYGKFVGRDVWNLVPGFCYLHQDATMFGPGAPGPGVEPMQETMQFTAYWSTSEDPYDLVSSFTTYNYKNLMSVNGEGFNYYLTMYGYDPETVPGARIPAGPYVAPTPMNWVHGMWLPTFMLEQKWAFREAQSKSAYGASGPNQPDNNIYFCGNNLTMDSEEGALISAMAVAEYAFGVPSLELIVGPGLPTTVRGLTAHAMYDAFSKLMFPGSFWTELELEAFLTLIYVGLSRSL